MPFYFRLDKATIYSAGDVFSPEEVRFHSLVVSEDQLSLPEADKLTSDLSLPQRRELIRDLAAQVHGAWNSVTVEEIQGRKTFRFGDTGKVLYQRDSIPERFDWFMLVVEDDTELRKIGSKLDEYFTDEKVDQVSNQIMSLLGTTTSPATAAGIALAKALMDGITFLLKGNENDQLGVIEQSFVRAMDYPDGRRYGTGVEDLSGNMWYDYTIFGTEENEDTS